MAGMVENWVAGFRTIDDGRTSVANYIWDTGGLAWIPQTGSGIGPATDVNVTNSSLAVTGPLTDAQLRSAPVEVSITDPAGVPLNTIVDTFHGGSILAVGLESLEDQHGFKGAFDPASQLQIAEPYRLVGTAFGAALDANFWAVASGGGAGAAAGVANSIATIASGTAGATGWAQISTLRSARFLFVHPLRFRAGIRLPTLAVSNCDTRGWGPTQLSSGLPQEGPFFKVDAAGLLHCCIVKAGVVTHDVVSGNFNGAVPGVTLNTNAHAFEVVYFTMGVWYIMDGVLLHTIVPTTSILFLVTTLPIGIWAKNNSTGGVSGTVECFNASILRQGRSTTAPTSAYIAGVTAGQLLKTGAGDIHKINLSTINANSSIILYDSLTASGTILWQFDSGNLDRGISYDFGGMNFVTGLTLVQTGAGTKTTIVYE